LSEVEIQSALQADDMHAQDEENKLAEPGVALRASRPLMADADVAMTIMAADRAIVRLPDDTDTGVQKLA
jgi:hypothetical protein